MTRVDRTNLEALAWLVRVRLSSAVA
jgi:hypothetical protein